MRGEFARQCPLIKHNFRRERRTEAESNRGRSFYSPAYRLTAGPNRLTLLALTQTIMTASSRSVYREVHLPWFIVSGGMSFGKRTTHRQATTDIKSSKGTSSSGQESVSCNPALPHPADPGFLSTLRGCDTLLQSVIMIIIILMIIIIYFI